MRDREPETEYSAVLDLGPGFNTVMERQIRLAVEGAFAKERIDKLVNGYVERKVREVVDEAVMNSKSSWMPAELKEHLAKRIEERMGVANIRKKIDAEIPKAWERFSSGSGEGNRELLRMIKSQITDRIWQLSHEGEGFKIVKASIERLILQTLQTASDDYAGRVFMQFIKTEEKKR